MQRAESDNSVSQVINWYLVQAEKGSHRDSGQPEDQSTLKIQWNMFTRHMSKEFRARPFKDLGTLDMQAVIDDAAASGSEKAASRLKDIFANVDKFAVQRGVITSPRTKKLLAPNINKVPKPLIDAAFKSAWDALSYCGNGGATIDRGPCLAILLSGVTLQPLGNLISMRRREVDFDRKLWVCGDSDRYVYLSDMGLDLISRAIELGDLIHRETKSEFVFPSGGPKRDVARPTSYSLTFDVVSRCLGKAATPHDLRQTGIARLYELGGDELQGLVNEISKGGLDSAPASMHIALIEGWAGRIRDCTKKTWS
jgi:integrase